ncbi:zinc finger protein 813-like isoform X1 [Artemia franciscana]|uniref:zinc finger protein 813-like isoform X1 n=1 Tax=Artemia franciscana TaxID=6661 RepID=UPI0032DB12E8
MNTPNDFAITAVKQELDDVLPNDHKNLFVCNDSILLPMDDSNLVIFFQDKSTKLEPNCSPLKLELNVNVDSEPKDESSNDGRHIFRLLSMKREDNLLACSPERSADCKPIFGHLKLESQSGKDKDNSRSQTVKKPFECGMCWECFATSSGLIFHQRTHTGEKPFKCDTCDRTFGQKSSLSNHQRTHTARKTFKCDICDKTFRVKCNLSSHLRAHTGEKPFKCDMCDKTFYQKSHLTYHQRSHTGEKPFKCDICDRTFSRKSILSDHERTHTEEKPFECDMCEKKFRVKCNLSSHRRTHTEEKPFKGDM